MIKEGARALALDDSSFKRGKGKVLVVGVMGRKGNIDGVISFSVDIDGSDATAKLVKAVSSTRFKEQIKIIAINGITLGGLNLVDLPAVSKKLNLPVVAITRKRPHFTLMEDAIVKASSKETAAKKLKIMNSIRKASTEAKVNGFYMQCIGIGKDELAPVADTLTSLLRLSHIIASGIARGESSGRI